MDWKNQRRGLQLFVVLMVGALLVGVMGAAEAVSIRSGLLRADGSNNTHCSVVNVGPGSIEVKVEIWFGFDGSNCSSDTHTIDPGNARGVTCSSPSSGTYCTVTSVSPSSFSTNNVRGIFSTRNAADETQAAYELK